ncbi:MAG: class I SAM-dependent methyltransferase [Deltaproteobacteria bacterium]|nr:class I SAM-dependent methyltransferase [Deltaproteobacteria bacterium]
MYVCPTCKVDLAGGVCPGCSFKTDLAEEIPSFFSCSEIANRYRDIARFYDDLYGSRPNAWGELVGRDAAFIAYVSSLVNSMNPARYLDIGCGQGFLLSAVSAPEKFGIDISRKAAEQARLRATAKVCQGIVEELPFPPSYFDVVTGIGVMEHFIDIRRATVEISRVLREGGSYLVWLFLEPPLFEKVMIRASQFIYPEFRPLGFCRWTLDKCGRMIRGRTDDYASHDPIRQPVLNRHTLLGMKRLFRLGGFRVKSLITKRRMPDAPLQGHNYRIYVLEKAVNSGSLLQSS